MYPSRIALFILLPIYVGCGGFEAADYALYKQPHVFLVSDRFWLGLAGLVAFAIGSLCVESGLQSNPKRLEVEGHDLRVVLGWLYAVTLAAYAIFLFPVLLKPQLVVELYDGSLDAAYTLRSTLERIPGVTTLSTLQSLCVVLHLLYRRMTGSTLAGIYNILLAALVVACLLRSWLWSERLALIELAVPAALVVVGLSAKRRSLLLAAGPLLGLLVVFALFCAGEYFRSWQFYRATWGDSFLSFAGVRFVGYYATALNNGALLYSVSEQGYYPLHTAVWFYKLPFWEALGVGLPPPDDISKRVLTAYGNPEFNNTSGIFQPFLDFGPAGGAFCWAGLGVASGLLLRSFAGSHLLGLILYPVWYVGILEILRIFYWGESRFFPVLAVACLAAAYLRSKANHAQRFRAVRLLIS
jgi:oligosaccharide repeat unit polymerase